MDLYLKGKVAVVTGGASGIGRKICHTYAEEGAIPVIFDVQEEAGKKVLKECEQLGVEAMFFHGDCSKQEVCAKAINDTIARFGKVDILVHDACPHVTDGSGIMPFLKETQQLREDFVNVLIWGTVYLSEAVLPHMLERKYGRLIYISSDARAGDAYEATYSACKAGIVGFMKSMAHLGGKNNVLANVVSPAVTLTDENAELLRTGYKIDTEEGLKRLTKAYPTRKLGTAQDLANMVVFLSSDRASDVTGQVVGVNGGFYMPSP